MKFSEFVGNDSLKSLFEECARKCKFPNSYLFSGDKGVGKFTMAKAIALAANSTGQEDDYKIETQIDENMYPDFIVVRPNESNITNIETVRIVQSALRYAPYSAKWRFVVIDECEKMTVEAANALLKHIEEPPERTTFILITSNKELVLDTLISRSHCFYFKPIPQLAIQEYLRKRAYLDEYSAKLISRQAFGSLGHALELAKDSELATRRKHFSEMFFNLFSKLCYNIIDEANEYDTKTQLEMISVWLSLTLDIVRANKDIFLVYNSEHREQIKKHIVPEQAALGLANMLIEVYGGIQNNANIRVCIEYLSAYMIALNKYFLED